MKDIKTAKDFIGNPEHKPNFQIKSTDGKEYWISRSCSVLAAVVSRDDTGWHILVNQRGPGCPDYQGCYNIPCGYIDWGETCQQACAREIFEECGIALNQNVFKLYSVNSDPKESSKQNITIRHIATLDPIWMTVSLSSIHSEKDEVSDIRWINFYEIDNYQWAFNHLELLKELHAYLKVHQDE